MARLTSVQGSASDRLEDVAWLAEYLGVPQQTIYRWRTHGDGPRGIKVGRHLRFRRSDVDAWLESQADSRPPAA